MKKENKSLSKKEKLYIFPGEDKGYNYEEC